MLPQLRGERSDGQLVCLVATLLICDFDAFAIVGHEFDLKHFLEGTGWSCDRKAHSYRVAHLETGLRKTLSGRLDSLRSGQIVSDVFRGDRGLRIERLAACRT